MKSKDTHFPNNILALELEKTMDSYGIYHDQTLLPTANNKHYKHLYDALAPFYDLFTNVYALFHGGRKKRLMQYLNTLNVNNNDRVIEISVGTGRNFIYLNPQAQYYGVDISNKMLKVCARKMQLLHRPVTLIQAEAEKLPIKDNSFDVVFSAGGFNFFNNRAGAIKEMLRIAKPGTLIMISDETEKIRQKHQGRIVEKSFYNQPKIIDPRLFVPTNCLNINYREIAHGELYVLTFIKPNFEK